MRQSRSLTARKPTAQDAVGKIPLASESRLAVHSSLTRPGQQPAAPDAPIKVGSHFLRIGPYQVVCELASGGMASVYLALHRSIEGFEKLCAVKRIHPHLAKEGAFAEMFVDEARIAARISHPYVCSVFSFGRSNDSHFIAMEFLRGEPLSNVSRRVARSPELGDDPKFPSIAARMLANLAEGLHAAHSLRDDQGALLEVVHRDVTPQNLFVLYDGSVRVTDFGIAHARQRLHHTQGQKLKGKLSYIAPELLNHQSVTAQADVWGLGVVLWELLAGRRLFLGSSEGETVAAVMSRVVRPPSDFRSTVPAELDRIVLRALTRDVRQRYRTARDLARDLEHFLKLSGDSVPSIDVADWMTHVFPEGTERLQGLLELAAHVSAATADETVVRVPSTPPGSGDPSAIPSIPTLPVVTATLDTPGAGANDPGMTPDSSRESVPAPPPAEPSSLGSSTPTTSSRRALAFNKGSKLPLFLASSCACLALLAVTGLWRSGTAPALSHPASSPVGHRPAGATRGAESPGLRASDAADLLPSPPSPDTISLDSLPLLDQEAPEPSATLVPAPPGRSTGRKKPMVVESARHEPPPPEPPPARLGELYVTTPGGTAKVFVDGVLLGSTPGHYRVPVGAHQLLVRDDLGGQRSVAVQVATGSPALITVPLPH